MTTLSPTYLEVRAGAGRDYREFSPISAREVVLKSARAATSRSKSSTLQRSGCCGGRDETRRGGSGARRREHGFYPCRH